MNTLKSKLIKLIMTGLLVLTAFAFIACGGNQNPENESGSDSGSGSGSDNVNEKDGILTAEQSAAKLKAIGDYDIVVEVTTIDDETISMEMAKKGNIYWFNTASVCMAFNLVDDICYTYIGMEDESGTIEWTPTESIPSTSMEDYLEQMDSAFEQSIFYAGDLLNNSDITFKKAGSITIAGRQCTKYTWRDSASAGGNSISVQETICIDNETGICMKLEAAGSANGDSESGSFEVKKFLTGNTVTAPNLPDPEPASDED